MIDPKTSADVAKIKLDDLLEFMRTKPAEEITALKAFANSTIEGNFGTRKPGFFEIRNWVISKYFPNIVYAEKKPKTKMIDRIMAL